MSVSSSHNGVEKRHLEGQKERQLAIAEMVIKQGTISVEDLSALTGVSSMTIYRDVASLEESGVLQRHRGQVVAVASGLHEADAEFRVEQSSQEKQWVAAKAGQLVTPGSSIMLDDSSSAVWLLRSLADLSSVSVVTNSLLVANEVAENRSTKLFVTGGEYQAWAHALMGPTVVQNVRAMHADICFLSASGISDLACFHPYQEVVEVKRAMLESAEVRVLLLDHTKFHRRALFKFADLTEFDHVVLDSGTPQAQIDELTDAGVQLMIADDPRSESSL